MDAEKVLNLFDFYWFHNQIFTKYSITFPLTNPDFKIMKNSFKLEISRLPSNIVRSQSDHELASKSRSSFSISSDSISPKSVLLFTHKLQTINSGREISEESRPIEVEFQRASKTEMRSRRRKKGSSKSLSELEFEELKGFMDLGFVFTEEDKNSKLGSIIPGLQRLGKKDYEEKNVEDEQNSKIPRPYLSEVWDVLDQIKEENPLMNWRIPNLDSEIAMKDHLRCWAHTVASAVK